MARYLACLIYRMLMNGQDWVDRGAAYYEHCGLPPPLSYTETFTPARSSTRGSFPKHLRRKLAQSNRPGFGRLFCPSSMKTAANVRVMERGNC
jgi:hypothetical protein